MDNRENKYSCFERELRNKVTDSTVNYKVVESMLFSRISDADALEELAILKLDDILTEGKIEQIEQNLFSRIIQYNEYELPINECISTEYDLSSAQWDRLAAKIEENIQENAALPEWEQVLKSAELEPLQGTWEVAEENLFGRIDKISQKEPWEQYTRLDQMHIQESLESVEKRLESQINNKSEENAWECVLKSEEILPYAKWEQFEEKLFVKLEKASQTVPIEKQPFWGLIDYYLLLTRVAQVGSVAIILALMIFGGLLIQKRLNQAIPTVAYQLQGKSVAFNDLINGRVGTQINSVMGGAISLVNSHGLVELQNESDVKIEQLSKQHAWYKVGFDKRSANDDIARGKVSFLVNPHHGKESFKVSTPDYQIIVKGTYFKVEPDLGGKVATRVLEGEIKVVSKLFADTVVKAGQSLVYDIFTNEYKIQGGGTVVQRKEIESVPDIEELLLYKEISIKSVIPEADIRIDGRYYGSAPLKIRQPVGLHHIWIGKTGYVSVDTTIGLTANDSSYSLDITLNAVTMPKIENQKAKVPAKIADLKPQIISPETVANQLLGKREEKVLRTSSADSLYLLAQKEETAGDWKEAISLYQSVFDNSDVSRLRKEDALFSIGKLKADHQLVGSDAKQVFLTYLALYPGGSFAGETWLRLAEIEFKTNPENAVQYYLKYFDMFPRHPRISELQNRVGIIYLQQKKYDEAIALFRQALSNLVSPVKGQRLSISMNLRHALEAKGDSKSADSIWRQYLVNSSDEK